jgi:hypothetical protein
MVERQHFARSKAALGGHWRGLLVVTPILAIVGVVHGVGMFVSPAFISDDEGTYMAQAWAVQTGRGAYHGLAPYTYWYDHPPFGWIQLAGLTAVTDTFRAGNVVVLEGRTFMLGYTLISAALVFLIARRLGFSLIWAAFTTALFGLSPLSVVYLRLVFLDNIGLPWILGSFALALSPKRRLVCYAASGALFAAGVLSKETYLLLLPALVWCVWQNVDRRTRRMCITVFSVVCLVVLSYYPLYAALKGELIPGPGHVSLIGGVEWQLAGRAGSGSIFSVHSASHAQLMSWLNIDPWLLALGAVSVIPAFLIRRLRPIAFAYATFILVLFHDGYLPEPLVIGALPFAALVVGGCGNAAWEKLSTLSKSGVENTILARWRQGILGLVCLAFLFGLIGVVTWHVAPEWVRADQTQMWPTAASPLTPVLDSERWVDTHVPKTATLLVDDDVWTDFVDDGWSPNRVVWAYKLDLDPEVVHRYPLGWRNMDYVIDTSTLRQDVSADNSSFGDSTLAIDHSRVVAHFGSGATRVEILKVNRAAAQNAPSPPRAGQQTIPGAPRQ